ncbi:unnamed protein product [Withania somnifera]
MRKYTTNPTAHSQLHSRFNPNLNPNFKLQNVSTLSHLRQVNESLPRAAPSPANNNVQFNWKPNAVDDRNEYVTFNLASYSRSELKDLKKRLISDLGRVRGVLDRIEAQDFVSGTSFHAREVIQPPTAPQLQPSLPPKFSRHQKKPELVGGKSKTTRNEAKRPVVEGDKFFVSMMRKCRQILMKIMKKKHGHVFNKPVDVKGMKLHDYYAIIKHPMDLGTVKSRLDRKEYRTPQDFAADVRLTLNNAMTYNPKGQDVHTMAGEYLGLFEEMFKPAYQKYEAEHHKVAAIRQVNHLKNLSRPALIPRPNALHEPLPVARKSHSVRSQSTVLNQHQFQVQSLNAPFAPLSATPAIKSPPQPVITPSSAKMPKAKTKAKTKDPNKRFMTFEEKAKLGDSLQDLPLEKMDQIVQIVKRKTPHLTQEGDEVELDFEIIDNETLWELDRFVSNHKKDMSKMKRQGITEDAAAVQFNKAPTPEHALPIIKKVDVGEEDVDIGEGTPGESFPPVQIDKDVPCASSGSSSSSSGSDSSSSDSDSGSSSGSDPNEDSVQSPAVEAAKVAPTT